MGNSMPCLCQSSSNQRVILMEENGNIISHKKGVLVKEITAVHRGHKVVKCGSDRSVLSDSSVLQSNRLYFLIRQELVVRDEVHDKFWQVAEAKGLLTPHKDEVVKISDGTVDDGQAPVSQTLLLEGVHLKNSPWRPRLQTIPEATPHVVKYI